MNPYARELTFLDDRTRTRRDHLKYLTLIRTIALLHQHQREVKTDEHEGVTTEYIEVTLEDIAIANRLAAEVLGRSLDELAPQTRRLLVLLEAMVRERASERKLARAAVRFSRRDVRAYDGLGPDAAPGASRRGWSSSSTWCSTTAANGLSYEYELVYDGRGPTGGRSSAGSSTSRRSRRAHGYDGNLAGCGGGTLRGTVRPLGRAPGRGPCGSCGNDETPHRATSRDQVLSRLASSKKHA